MVLKRLLQDYLSPGDVFHLAWTDLISNAWPAVHNHDYFEVFWVEHGQVLHQVNAERQIFEPGDMVFIRPDDTHALRGKGGASRIGNLSFFPETLDAILSRHHSVVSGQTFWSSGRCPDSVRLGLAQQRTLSAWVRRLEASGRGQLPLDAFLLAVLGLLVADDPLPEGADTGPRWLVESCRALAQSDVLRTGVKGFVAVSGLAPEHVARATRKHTGKSPSKLVAQARMALAARLLTSTSLPIAHVAMEVGLDNLSHFHAQFKTYHAMTPRAYRIRHGADLVQGRRDNRD